MDRAAFVYEPLPGPDAAVQIQLPEIRQIHRRERQPPAARVYTRRVRGPDAQIGRLVKGHQFFPAAEGDALLHGDAQRGKEMLLCKVQHGLPGHPRQNAGQDVRPDERCVAKFADRPLPAQQIEGEPHPVRAGKILRVGCGAIFVGRGHGEHVPDRDALDRLFAPLGRVFREKFQDLLIDASKAAPVQRDPEQDRDNALGHREHVKTAFGRAAAKIAFIDGLAVLPNDHPGDIAVVRRDGRFQFHDVFLFHLCFLISRCLP